MCRTVNFKFSSVSGIATNLLYDMIDNQGNYVFQQLTGTQLLTGLTLSINNAAISFNLNSNRLSGTWSTCNPYTPGLNAPPVYATWDPAQLNSNATLDSTKLIYTLTSGTNNMYSTIGIGSTSSNKKVYWEVVITSAGGLSLNYIGVGNGTSGANNIGDFYNQYASFPPGGPPYNASGSFVYNGSTYTYYPTNPNTAKFESGYRMSFALDMSAGSGSGKLYFFINGVQIGSGAMATALIDGQKAHISTGSGVGYVATANFGQSAFTYYDTLTIGGSSLASLGFVRGVY